MRKLLPDSLRWRMLLVLLAGLGLSHLASTYILSSEHHPDLWSAHSLDSFSVMMGGILLLGYWSASWVLAPLANFTQAAERLGKDVQAQPLAEAGPREVRQAIIAFNQMQKRINKFVEDRTHMLAAISHDLRSPITRMRLRVEMLPGNEVQSKTLNDLAEMEAMVNASLEFTRDDKNSEQSQNIDITASLQTVCDEVTDQGFKANFLWQERLLCHCRPLAIKRALTNLIENAAIYGNEAQVQVYKEKGEIVIEIRDKGPGIPEALQEKVFTPFYRLEGSRNRQTGGVGLGLSVARTIIRARGGEISLCNLEPNGLLVRINLPQ